MTREEAIIPGLEELISQFPSVNPQPDISKDGTLTVHVKDGSKVSRVLVCGDNHWGGLYYPEQEPKTGHWMKQDLGYKCSNCTLCTNEKGRLTYNYCPNCGTKMERED